MQNSNRNTDENTVSTWSDENQYQDRQYDSDDQYSDFEDTESVEAYDENELYQDEEEANDARNLNDLKKGEELSKSKIINSRQLENESILLSDTTGDDLNQHGQHQESEIRMQKQPMLSLVQVNTRHFLLLLVVQWWEVQ